ncbi:mannitol dehydrogenase family protein [Dongia rigui]|uniref:Mannitol dehydrogenase family protein n=1 Tax=Dongia rigui TaxID=940149 RepID=A0ABU5E221_9PROT|nr:mannitol dehydrogenase family protein [Dongia rigui]MDY0873610.1 mannitol dehydrogenase family protein [Dongia rigui]
MTAEGNVRRLSASGAGIGLPYDRRAVTPGIVHLGVGAFQRAHLAVYTDDTLKMDPSWGIVGASLRRPDTRAALQPQDFLYTVAIRDGDASQMRIVGALLDVLDATTQRDALLAAMVDPRIRIITLTVTEKGYCHDPATGWLDPDHPDIRHDLANPAAPISVPGLLVRALELRRARGAAPIAILCCDNLPANGETTARVVTGFAALRDSDLARYIAVAIAFPSTMVDRIVPATTDLDRLEVSRQTGFDDAWPVVTEPFSQWVIEDRFPAGRPAWESAGAQMVADVRPFELMKLRMLNGSHSILAYLGYLSGHAHVAEAVANPQLRQLIHGFMTEEVMPTLPPCLGDLAAYRDLLLQRFGNSALKHRTWQIAMDGSQKLPQRLLSTIRARLAAGLSAQRAILGVAAWLRYATGLDENGNVIDVRDPLAARLKTALSASAASDALDRVLAMHDVFGTDLPNHAGFRAEIERQYISLLQEGALATVRRLLERCA